MDDKDYQDLQALAAEFANDNDPRKMKPDDPAYWMLFNGVESTPVVHSDTCYICRDPEFAQMGLPLCRKCPACGGHVQADDTVCDSCGLDDQAFWHAVRDGNSRILAVCFSTGAPDWKSKLPSNEELWAAEAAYERERGQ